MFKFITTNAALTSDSFGIPCGVIANRVFHWRFTSGRIFNNKLLLSLCFLEIFVVEQGFDREEKVMMGHPPVPYEEKL